MADFQLDFDDSIFKGLDKLSDTEKISAKMLQEASPIVVESMKSELKLHKQTSELVNSVKPTKPRRNKNGDNVVIVRPTGKSMTMIAESGKTYVRKKPVRNMEKLASLEFGNSHGQKPTSVIEKVIKSAENAVLDKMTEVYNKEVEL